MRTVRDLLDLTGRVALVTGGAGHIGGAIAEALAEQGAWVQVVDRRFGQTPAGISCWHCDISDIAAIDDLTARVFCVLHRVDILVNCAAALDLDGLDVGLMDQTMQAWDQSMAVNLRAAFRFCQACAPMLAASGHGSIINVGSIYGLLGPDLRLYGDTGMGCGAAYAASKGALLQLTRHLATVLAPSIRVNAITPGGVLRGQDAVFRERYESRVPLGRMATETDFKGAAVFLASDASEYVTGQNIIVDGGFGTW